MKISAITDEEIVFDNGMTIAYDDDEDCCTLNYADFKQIDDLARSFDFDETKMQFIELDEKGFLFGSDPNRMFFVPCYSEQNGWYSCHIYIYFNNKMVLSTVAEFVEV